MLNDQVSAAGQVDRFAKSGFHLFSDSEMVKNGRTVTIIGNNINFIGRNPLDIGLRVVEKIAVIDHNFIEILIEQIPEHTGCLGLFTQDFCRSNSTYEVMLNQLPCRYQVGQVLM